MPHQTAKRIEALEHAVMNFEGAHYALHDLVAVLLARSPDQETRAVFQALADQVSIHADKIGEIRLAGYTQELESIQVEVTHARGDARSLFSRLARSLSSSTDDIA